MTLIRSMLADFKQLAANVAATLAAAGATVAAIDYFLSSAQKSWLESKNLSLWYWLSSQSAGTTLKKYKNEFMFEALLKYMLFSFGLAMVILSPIMGAETLVRGVMYIILGAINIAVVSVILKIGPVYNSSYLVYDTILEIKQPVLLFLISSLLQLIWIAVWIGFISLLYLLVGSAISDDAFYYITLALSTFVAPVFTAYLAICTLSTQFLVISFLSFIYSRLEWFVRKSAESDKGVILGASAALGAISTFIKNFS